METVPARLTNGITFSKLRSHKYTNDDYIFFKVTFILSSLYVAHIIDISTVHLGQKCV